MALPQEVARGSPFPPISPLVDITAKPAGTCCNSGAQSAAWLPSGIENI